MTNQLTVGEFTELAALENKIAVGLKTFVEVGEALAKIRDSRLYRAKFGTFEEYCQERWGMKRAHAYRLIESAGVIANLSPIGDIPETESQARPLTRLEPQQQRDAWQQAVDTAPGGKVTAAHVEAVVAQMTTAAMPELVTTSKPHFYQTTTARQDVATTMFSSESNEYYTPVEYIEAARQVMGGIDLDPASCAMAQETVKATRYFTIETDGLSQQWAGRIYLNPPYGKVGNESSQGYWAQRLNEEYAAGHVTEAVLLVKAALGYEWFEQLWDDMPVCFPRRRLSFIMPGEQKDGQSKQGSALFYFGRNVDRFIEVFSNFGRVILPEDHK